MDSSDNKNPSPFANYNFMAAQSFVRRNNPTKVTSPFTSYRDSDKSVHLSPHNTVPPQRIPSSAFAAIENAQNSSPASRAHETLETKSANSNPKYSELKPISLPQTESVEIDSLGCNFQQDRPLNQNKPFDRSISLAAEPGQFEFDLGAINDTSLPRRNKQVTPLANENIPKPESPFNHPIAKTTHPRNCTSLSAEKIELGRHGSIKHLHGDKNPKRPSMSDGNVRLPESTSSLLFKTDFTKSSSPTSKLKHFYDKKFSKKRSDERFSSSPLDQMIDYSAFDTNHRNSAYNQNENFNQHSHSFDIDNGQVENQSVLGQTSDYVVKKYYIYFKLVAQKIINQVCDVRLDIEPDLASLIDKGVNTELDSILDTLGSLSKTNTQLIVELLLIWRKSTVDQVPVSLGGIQDRANHIIRERRSLTTVFLLCRALFEVASNIDPLLLTDDFGDLIEDLVFSQIQNVNPNNLQSSKNRKVIQDLYAQIAGEISRVRFASISDKFIAALERIPNQTKTDVEKCVILIRSMRYLKLVLHPMEALEESSQFILSCAKFFARTSGSMRLKHAWAMTLTELLMPLAGHIGAEVNMPILSQAVEIIHAKALKMSQRVRHIFVAFPLLSASLSLSRSEFFYSKWQAHLEACIQRLKDKHHRLVAVDSITRILWVYVFRYPEAQSVVTRKLDSLLRILFPVVKSRTWQKTIGSESIFYILVCAGCYNFDFTMKNSFRSMLALKNIPSDPVYWTIGSSSDSVLEDLNPERALLAYQAIIEIANIFSSSGPKHPPFPPQNTIDFYDGYFGSKRDGASDEQNIYSTSSNASININSSSHADQNVFSFQRKVVIDRLPENISNALAQSANAMSFFFCKLQLVFSDSILCNKYIWDVAKNVAPYAATVITANSGGSTTQNDQNSPMQKQGLASAKDDSGSFSSLVSGFTTDRTESRTFFETNDPEASGYDAFGNYQMANSGTSSALSRSLSFTSPPATNNHITSATVEKQQDYKISSAINAKHKQLYFDLMSSFLSSISVIPVSTLPLPIDRVIEILILGTMHVDIRYVSVCRLLISELINPETIDKRLFLLTFGMTAKPGNSSNTQTIARSKINFMFRAVYCMSQLFRAIDDGSSQYLTTRLYKLAPLEQDYSREHSSGNHHSLDFDTFVKQDASVNTSLEVITRALKKELETGTKSKFSVYNPPYAFNFVSKNNDEPRTIKRNNSLKRESTFALKTQNKFSTNRFGIADSDSEADVTTNTVVKTHPDKLLSQKIRFCLTSRRNLNRGFLDLYVSVLRVLNIYLRSDLKIDISSQKLASKSSQEWQLLVDTVESIGLSLLCEDTVSLRRFAVLILKEADDLQASLRAILNKESTNSIPTTPLSASNDQISDIHLNSLFGDLTNSTSSTNHFDDKAGDNKLPVVNALGIATKPTSKSPSVASHSFNQPQHLINLNSRPLSARDNPDKSENLPIKQNTLFYAHLEILNPLISPQRQPKASTLAKLTKPTKGTFSKNPCFEARTSIFFLLKSLSALDTSAKPKTSRKHNKNSSQSSSMSRTNFQNLFSTLYEQQTDFGIILGALRKSENYWKDYMQGFYKDGVLPSFNEEAPSEEHNLHSMAVIKNLNSSHSPDTGMSLVDLSCNTQLLTEWKFQLKDLLNRLSEAAPKVIITARSIICQKMYQLHPLVLRIAESSSTMPVVSFGNLYKAIPSSNAACGAANNIYRASSAKPSSTFNTFGGFNLNDSRFYTQTQEGFNNSKFDTTYSTGTSDTNSVSYGYPSRNINGINSNSSPYMQSHTSNAAMDELFVQQDSNMLLDSGSELAKSKIGKSNVKKLDIWNKTAFVPIIESYCSYLMFLVASLNEKDHEQSKNNSSVNTTPNDILSTRIPTEKKLDKKSQFQNLTEKASKLGTQSANNKSGGGSMFQLNWAKKFTGPLKISTKASKQEDIVECRTVKQIVKIVSPFLLCDHVLLRNGVIGILASVKVELIPELINEVKPLHDISIQDLYMGISDYIQANTNDVSADVSYKVSSFNCSFINNAIHTTTLKPKHTKPSGNFRKAGHSISSFISSIKQSTNIGAASGNGSVNALMTNSSSMQGGSNFNNFVNSTSSMNTQAENSAIFNSKKSVNNNSNPRKTGKLRISLAVLYTLAIRSLITSKNKPKAYASIKDQSMIEQLVIYVKETQIYLSNFSISQDWEHQLLRIALCGLVEALYYSILILNNTCALKIKTTVGSDTKDNSIPKGAPALSSTQGSKALLFSGLLPIENKLKPPKSINKRYSKGNSESSIGISVEKGEHTRSSSADLAIRTQGGKYRNEDSQFTVETRRGLYKLMESWCSNENGYMFSTGSDNKIFQSAISFYSPLSIDKSLLIPIIEDEILQLKIAAIRLKSLLLKDNFENSIFSNNAISGDKNSKNSSTFTFFSRLLLWAIEVYSSGIEEMQMYAVNSIEFFVRSEFSRQVILEMLGLVWNPSTLILKLSKFKDFSGANAYSKMNPTTGASFSAYSEDLVLLLNSVLVKLLASDREFILGNSNLYNDLFCLAIYCMQSESDEIMENSIETLKILAKYKFPDFCEAEFDLIKEQARVYDFNLYSRSRDKNGFEIVSYFAMNSPDKKDSCVSVATTIANLITRLCTSDNDTPFGLINLDRLSSTLLKILNQYIIASHEEVLHFGYSTSDIYNENLVYILVYITQELYQTQTKLVYRIWESLICGEYYSDGLHNTESVLELVQLFSKMLYQNQSPSILQTVGIILSLIVSITYLSDSTYKLVETCLGKLEPLSFVPSNLLNPSDPFCNQPFGGKMSPGRSENKWDRVFDHSHPNNGGNKLNKPELWWTSFIKNATAISCSDLKNPVVYSDAGFGLFLLSIIASHSPQVLINNKQVYDIIIPICLFSSTCLDSNMSLVRSSSCTILIQIFLVVSGECLKRAMPNSANETIFRNALKTSQLSILKLRKYHSGELFEGLSDINPLETTMDMLKVLCLYDQIAFGNQVKLMENCCSAAIKFGSSCPVRSIASVNLQLLRAAFSYSVCHQKNCYCVFTPDRRLVLALIDRLSNIVQIKSDEIVDFTNQVLETVVLLTKVSITRGVQTEIYFDLACAGMSLILTADAETYEHGLTILILAFNKIEDIGLLQGCMKIIQANDMIGVRFQRMPYENDSCNYFLYLYNSLVEGLKFPYSRSKSLSMISKLVNLVSKDFDAYDTILCLSIYLETVALYLPLILVVLKTKNFLLLEDLVSSIKLEHIANVLKGLNHPVSHDFYDFIEFLLEIPFKPETDVSITRTDVLNGFSRVISRFPSPNVYEGNIYRLWLMQLDTDSRTQDLDFLLDNFNIADKENSANCCRCLASEISLYYPMDYDYQTILRCTESANQMETLTNLLSMLETLINNGQGKLEIDNELDIEDDSENNPITKLMRLMRVPGLYERSKKLLGDILYRSENNEKPFSFGENAGSSNNYKFGYSTNQPKCLENDEVLPNTLFDYKAARLDNLFGNIESLLLKLVSTQLMAMEDNKPEIDTAPTDHNLQTPSDNSLKSADSGFDGDLNSVSQTLSMPQSLTYSGLSSATSAEKSTTSEGLFATKADHLKSLKQFELAEKSSKKDQVKIKKKGSLELSSFIHSPETEMRSMETPRNVFMAPNETVNNNISDNNSIRANNINNNNTAITIPQLERADSTSPENYDSKKKMANLVNELDSLSNFLSLSLDE